MSRTGLPSPPRHAAAGSKSSQKRRHEISRRVLAWFDRNARDLPWRRSNNPYHIWVSEIMLQQTRVGAVFEHYARFLAAFPTVDALARAKEEEVLAVWSGLGYYRRAMNLHRAAQQVDREMEGRLPGSAETLLKLPGVGRYTAAAIASIAFGEPVVAIDGNVERIVLRLFPWPEGGRANGDGGAKAAPPDIAPRPVSRSRWVRGIAELILDPKRPGDFNQAMMDLGATVCLPRRPLCAACPLHSLCRTRGEHPVPASKPMRSRQIAYALCERGCGGARKVLLVQRAASERLMPGMWELPEITAGGGAQLGLREGITQEAEFTLRHSITVTNYRVAVLRVSGSMAVQLSAGAEQSQWAAYSELDRLAVTGLTRKILRRRLIADSQPGRRRQGRSGCAREVPSERAPLLVGSREGEVDYP